jgi:predicted ArsR family transcriptional regulator
MTNVMTNLTARQQILIYLGQHKGASAAEISRALRVTTANIRRHLSILAADGRVQILGLRPADGPGRPVQIYGLADEGDHLAGLAGALLAQVVEGASKERQDVIMRALAMRLLPERSGPGDKNVNVTRRLAACIEQLNRLGYVARWEAHAAAPRIIFEHCPYRLLVTRHPELCRMDAFLLSESLGRDVEQSAKLEKNARGTEFCLFVM